jgi:hypothetical protein
VAGVNIIQCNIWKYSVLSLGGKVTSGENVLDNLITRSVLHKLVLIENYITEILIRLL